GRPLGKHHLRVSARQNESHREISTKVCAMGSKSSCVKYEALRDGKECLIVRLSKAIVRLSYKKALLFNLNKEISRIYFGIVLSLHYLCHVKHIEGISGVSVASLKLSIFCNVK
ncbi:MAG: hypothetical protein Q3994_06620, partial [Prevotella sp.]|nr:hypothetical protein [Prevotella sp.]